MRHSYLVRYLQLVFHNRLVLPLYVPIVKGKHSREHLVQDYAHGPPICGHVVAITFEDFRSKVGWSTSDFIRDLVMAENFCDAKVNNLQIAILVEDQVLQLKIAMHDVAIVEILKSKNQLHAVKFNVSFRKLNGLSKNLS